MRPGGCAGGRPLFTATGVSNPPPTDRASEVPARHDGLTARGMASDLGTSFHGRMRPSGCAVAATVESRHTRGCRAARRGVPRRPASGSTVCERTGDRGRPRRLAWIESGHDQHRGDRGGLRKCRPVVATTAVAARRNPDAHRARGRDGQGRELAAGAAERHDGQRVLGHLPFAALAAIEVVERRGRASDRAPGDRRSRAGPRGGGGRRGAHHGPRSPAASWTTSPHAPPNRRPALRRPRRSRRA